MNREMGKLLSLAGISKVFSARSRRRSIPQSQSSSKTSFSRASLSVDANGGSNEDPEILTPGLFFCTYPSTKNQNAGTGIIRKWQQPQPGLRSDPCSCFPRMEQLAVSGSDAKAGAIPPEGNEIYRRFSVFILPVVNGLEMHRFSGLFAPALTR